MRGSITSKYAIGVYHYEKQLPREQRLCEVRVFQFWVAQQLDDWPEKRQRETRWFDAPEAGRLRLRKTDPPRSFAWLLRPPDRKVRLATLVGITKLLSPRRLR